MEIKNDIAKIIMMIYKLNERINKLEQQQYQMIGENLNTTGLSKNKRRKKNKIFLGFFFLIWNINICFIY